MIGFDDAVKIVNEITELKPMSVGLIGGEIFLYPKLFEIIELLNKANIIVNLATNGTLIHDQEIEKIVQANIGSVQISLDGSTEEVNDSIRGEGTFVRIKQVIEILIAKGQKVDIAPLICQKNKDDIINIIQLADSLGVASVRFNLFIPSGKGNEVADQFTLTHSELEEIFMKIEEFEKTKNLQTKLYKPCFANFYDIISDPDDFHHSQLQQPHQLVTYACQAGRRKMAILPNGDVTACEFLMNSDNGNIFKRSLLEIWMDPSTFNKWRNPRKLKGKCARCPLFNHCLGGCRANAELYSGDFHSEDPLCWFDF